MHSPEQIITVKQFHKSNFKEKGSEFIAHVYPVEDQESCAKILESIKKKFYDAAHHCYAYKLLNEIQKYSDDGEPSGTAGIRILNAIDHFNLTNLLVVVTRYFGGTKLGVGPLGKAYYSSAFNVLEEAKHSKKELVEKLIVKMDFSLVSQLYRIAANYKAKVNSSEFETDALYEIIINPNFIDAFNNELNDATNGKIEVKRKGMQFYI